MPLTLQQVADTEALLLVWYQVLREIREEGPMQVANQPSGEQLRLWVDLYGFDSTEFGLRNGIRRFLRKKEINRIVLSAKDTIWMINYINVVVKGTRATFENARSSAPDQAQRAPLPRTSARDAEGFLKTCPHDDLQAYCPTCLASAKEVNRADYPSRIDYAEACYKAGILPEPRKPWKEDDINL